MSTAPAKPPLRLHATSAQILAITLPTLSLDQLQLVQRLMRDAMNFLDPKRGPAAAIEDRRFWQMANALDDVDARINTLGGNR